MSVDDVQTPRKERLRGWQLFWRLFPILAIVVLFVSLLVPAPTFDGLPRDVAIARNDGFQFVAAIRAYKEDHGVYPCEPNKGDNSQDFFAFGGPAQARIVSILEGKTHAGGLTEASGTNGIVYLDIPKARDLDHPANGIGRDGVWYDPHGNPYAVKIDSNYDGAITNPYSADAGDSQLKAGVIVWSLGPDGKGATSSTGAGDKNEGVNRDDVTSWQ